MKKNVHEFSCNSGEKESRFCYSLLNKIKKYAFYQQWAVRLVLLCFLIQSYPAFSQTPGGLTNTNLQLWLKADKGVTGTTTTVTGWIDHAGKTTVTRTQRGTGVGPALTGVSMNHNPAITFSKSGANYAFLRTNTTSNPTSTSATLMVVYKTVQSEGGARLNTHFYTTPHLLGGEAAQMAADFGFGLNQGRLGLKFVNTTISEHDRWNPESASSTATGIPFIGTGTRTNSTAAGSANIYTNGLNVGSNVSDATALSNSTFMGIGNSPADASAMQFSGDISEVIVFDKVLTAAERNRVESYLAIKYGITLNQSSAQNYVASNGAVLWNATANNGYNSNIAGIARDDASALNQKQSTSVNGSFQITMGNGNTIAGSNTAHNQNFAGNLSAVLWGDNGGGTTAWTSAGAPANAQIISRTWKVQVTGTVGTVKIRVPATGLPSPGAGRMAILVDNDNNFSTGATAYPMTQNGADWEVEGLRFSNGQFFTIAAVTCTGPAVGDVIFTLGTASERCTGTGNVTYAASAANATSITYSLDAASIIAGNTINPATGQVSYTATWVGTTTIQATAAGCLSESAVHTVSVRSAVSTPVFSLGAASRRCQGAGTVRVAATATNSTSITYSLDATSLTAGNTINSTTGDVTLVTGWSGVSVVTATANGCNGLLTASHLLSTEAVIAENDTVAAIQGVPVSFNVLANDRCNINPGSVTIATQPTSGFIQNNGNGNFTYLPFGNFTGQATFTYQVCTNAPATCAQATVVINVIEDEDDICSQATKEHIFYMPFPENNTQLRQALLSAADRDQLSANSWSNIGISIVYPGTVITYDHWEDGYEADITKPVQSTTRVWGDGNPANGVAPGYPDDIIPPGGYIFVENGFAWNRSRSVVVYDGKDKIHSSSAISVTKVAADAGSAGGSVLFDLQNVKTNVSDISKTGRLFVLPFGENTTVGGTGAFRYTGLFVNAVENNTVVKLDYNGDGIDDVTSPVLNEGEVWFYNGVGSSPGNRNNDINRATDIKAGARLTADKPIGVNLVFGGINNYGTRNIPVFPSQYYGSSYVTPVYSTNGDAPVYAMFVNPNNRAITINWTRGSGSPSAGSFTVAANNGINYFNINTATGMRFQSAGGESFTAVIVVDAGDIGSAYDWAYNMVPVERLTDFATLAWAPSTNGYNPLWVTPTKNTTVYVKYDGNLATGPNTSHCSAKYDVAITLNALESRLINGPNNTNSGMAVFNCDNVPMAVAWGQRPFGGTPTATPGLDVGYTVEPKCLAKMVFAVDDRRVTGMNTPVTIDVVRNDTGFLATVDPGTVNMLGLLQPTHGSAVINPDGTITYMPGEGFTGNDKFEYRICSSAPNSGVCDVATVYIRVPCAFVPGTNVINGIVFDDANFNGVFDTGEQGVQGATVNLYRDVNANGVMDADTDTLVTSQVTASGGTYSFTRPEDFRLRDAFNTNGSGTGSNGTVNWTPLPWVEISESDGFGAGNIRVTGNKLRIAGDGGGGQAGARRTANLAGAISAVLTYDFSKSAFSHTTADWVDVQVSNAVSGTYATLARYSGMSASLGSASFDITPYISANTTIRFIESSDGGYINTEYIDFDNIQIQYDINTYYIVQAPRMGYYGLTVPVSPEYYPVSFAGTENGVCEKIFGFREMPIAVNDTISGLQIGTAGVVDPLRNDSAPSGKTLNPASVSLIAASIPGAICTNTDAQGDCIAVNVPNQGNWTVNATSGLVTFTPFTSFTGDPTPINYTVKDNTGVPSNHATIYMDYLARPICNLPITNGDFATNLNGWTVTGGGWSWFNGQAGNWSDGAGPRILAQTIPNVTQGALLLRMTFGAQRYGSANSVLTVSLGGTAYATFTVAGNGSGNVVAAGLNGAVIRDFSLTAGSGTYTSDALSIDIPNYTGSSSAALQFSYTGGEHDVLVDNISLEGRCPILISGTVFNDLNRNTRIDNSETGTTAGTDLYVYLVNSSNIIVDSVKVGTTGNYILGTAVTNANYTIRLSPNRYALGSNVTTTPVATTLPVGWVHTGENGSNNTGAGDGTPNGILAVTIGTASLSQQNFGITQAPIAVNDTISGLPIGTAGVVDPLRNDSAPSGMTLNPTSVSLVAASVPTATCTSTDAQGDCITVNVPNQGIWTVNPTSGLVTFTPFTSFTGDPTPINYTVRDNTGLSSNQATIYMDYLAAPACEFAITNGNFNGQTGWTGWGTSASGWYLDPIAPNSATIAVNNVSDVRLTQVLNSLPSGELTLNMTLGAQVVQSGPANLSVILDGVTYATFTNTGTIVNAVGFNGAVVHDFSLTPTSSITTDALSIIIPGNINRSSSPNLQFSFTGGTYNFTVGAISLLSRCPINISGTVFNDVNGNTRIDNAETGTTAGTDLYVYLVNSSNIIVDSTKVGTTGNYILGTSVGNTTYTVQLSPNRYAKGTNVVTTPIATTLPTGWVRTGENGNNNTGPGDGTPDGILAVTVGIGNVSQQNFGIQQPPTAANDQSLNNNYGTPVTVNVLANDSDPAPGTLNATTVSMIVPGNATNIITDSNGDIISMVVPGQGTWKADTVSGAITFTPQTGFNGNPTPIQYTVKDNGGFISNPATVTITYLSPVLVSGTVFNDANGNTRIDVGENGTTASTALYVYLVNIQSGLVTDSSRVSSYGTYTLDASQNQTYTIELSGQPYPPGTNTNAINRTLPTGWVSTGENGNNNTGPGDGSPDGKLTVYVGTVNVSQQNFGIQQPPVADDKIFYIPNSAFNLTPPAGFPNMSTQGARYYMITTDNSMLTGYSHNGLLTGKDEEDCPDTESCNSGSTFVLDSLYATTLLFYDFGGETGVRRLVNGDTIKNYNPTKLVVYAREGAGMSEMIGFTYSLVDAAGFASPPASYTILTESALPVELISFEVTQLSSQVLLDWRTASELNNDYFEIERSIDGINWEVIGIVQGHGTATQAHNYSFIDRLPLSGISYYRLKQTDFDGQYEYSRVRVVTFEYVSPLKWYPNPTSGQITVENIQKNVWIRIYNMSGALVYENQLTGNTHYQINLERLPSGTYYMHINDGKTNQAEKIIIQK